MTFLTQSNQVFLAHHSLAVRLTASTFFSAFTVCWLGDKKGIQPVENLYQQSPAVITYLTKNNLPAVSS